MKFKKLSSKVIDKLAIEHGFSFRDRETGEQQATDASERFAKAVIKEFIKLNRNDEKENQSR